MANGRSKIGNRVKNFIQGLEDFQPAVLDKDMKANLNVIDPDNSVPKRSIQPVGVSSMTSQAAKALTPGQEIQRLTPRGTSEPEEMEEAGKAVSQVGKALANPAAIEFLADMGIAFAKGAPGEPGTILGQSAKQGAQRMRQEQKGQAITQVAAELLGGTPLSEIDTSGLTMQEVQSAVNMATSREQLGLQEKATEADIEQGEKSLSLEEERIGLQERAQDLQERGIELDEDMFEEEKLMNEHDMAMAEAELTLRERNAGIQDRIAGSLVKLREAQIQDLQSEDPREQAQLMRARNEAITTISSIIQREESKLNTLEAQLQEALDEQTSVGTFIEAFVTPGQSVNKRRLQEQLTVEDVEAQLDKQRTFVEDLRTTLQELSEVGNIDTTSGEEDEALEAGASAANPVEVSSRDDILKLDAGTYVRNPNGIVGIVQEDGTVEF